MAPWRYSESLVDPAVPSGETALGNRNTRDVKQWLLVFWCSTVRIDAAVGSMANNRSTMHAMPLKNSYHKVLLFNCPHLSFPCFDFLHIVTSRHFQRLQDMFSAVAGYRCSVDHYFDILSSHQPATTVGKEQRYVRYYSFGRADE